VLIIDGATDPTINGVPLPIGSYVGVFFDAGGGILECGGYREWTRSNTAVAAFGYDDSIFTGFLNGESFKFKLLLPNGQVVDSVLATFASPPGIRWDPYQHRHLCIRWNQHAGIITRIY